MKAYVVEMTRTMSRKLPGGETESLTAGTRYTVDEATKALIVADEMEQIPATDVMAAHEQNIGPHGKVIDEIDLDPPKAEPITASVPTKADSATVGEDE